MRKVINHISKAIFHQHGRGLYDLLSNNCEHFATLCVCGIPFSEQADRFKFLFSTDLAEEFRKNDEMFEKEMISTQSLFWELQFGSTISDFKDNPELIKEWTKAGFINEQIREWLDFGLKIEEYEYQDKVIQIADLLTIDNTYTALLHNLSKIISTAGAGIYLYGEVNDSNNYYKGIGGSITVTSLLVDFVASSYRERRYRPEERKKERDQFITEMGNLYNSYQELTILLQDLRKSDSLKEFSKLIKSLKKELTEISKKGEIKENNQ
ncbi:6343_t:CDS:2 [Funneliformis geosporum]|nr:6343_t:CDS:2 [Funneliformis geosporum]